MSETNSLEARLRRLEDLHEITTLVSHYAVYANVGEGSGDIVQFCELFTDDCVWDLSGDVRSGKAEIAARLREVEKLQYIGLHFALNPRIEVKGDEAEGKWDLNFPVIPPGEKQPRVVCGFYEGRMRRTAAGWKISYFKYRVSEAFSLARKD